MTKAEALELLRVNNCMNHDCNNKAWTTVIAWYREQTGVHPRDSKQCCDSCHSKILRWLRS